MNIGDVSGADLLLFVHLLSEALLVGEGVRQRVAVTHLAKPGVVVVVMMLLVMMMVVLVETMMIWQQSSKVLGWKPSRLTMNYIFKS